MNRYLLIIMLCCFSAHAVERHMYSDPVAAPLLGRDGYGCVNNIIFHTGALTKLANSINIGTGSVYSTVNSSPSTIYSVDLNPFRVFPYLTFSP